MKTCEEEPCGFLVGEGIEKKKWGFDAIIGRVEVFELEFGEIEETVLELFFAFGFWEGHILMKPNLLHFFIVKS